MVDRTQKPSAQQLGQFAGIYPVILVTCFQQRILPRIAHHQLRYVLFEQRIQPCSTGSLLKRHY